MNNLFEDYVTNVVSVIKSINLAKLEEVCDLLISVRGKSNFIFLAGNGGSAATAEHMAIDLMFGSKAQSPSFKTICLSSNSSSLSATGNDRGNEYIFSRQLKNLGQKGDLLIVISASGNSKNLIIAVEKAKQLEIKTLGILGFDGGELIRLVDDYIHAETEIGAYGIAEDVHLMINHMLVEYFKERFKS